MEKRKLSKTEIHNIANLARNTLNIDTEILILKRKTFKTTIGTSQRGGTYNYFQDKVLINKSELDLRTLPHSKWTIFHEYGHAYFARIFAKNGLFPMIVYAANIENALIESGVKHMWNGLCDCFVNGCSISDVKTGFFVLLYNGSIRFTRIQSNRKLFRRFSNCQKAIWNEARHNLACRRIRAIPTSFFTELRDARESDWLFACGRI